MLKSISVWGLAGQVQRNKKNVRELGIVWELVSNGRWSRGKEGNVRWVGKDMRLEVKENGRWGESV